MDDQGTETGHSARITRISVTASFSDGTVITASADGPVNPELEISRDLDLPSVRAGDLFRIAPAAPVRVSASFEGRPERPVSLTVCTALKAAALPLDGAEVWVAETWRAHGYGHGVQGVYDSREAAFEALKTAGMTVWTGEDGNVHGRPRNEQRWGAEWGVARPVAVRGRASPEG